jgi:hypothetical protein
MELVLRVADEDEKLATISEFRPYTDAFVVSKIMARDIESRAERCQQRFIQQFARLLLSGINNI